MADLKGSTEQELVDKIKANKGQFAVAEELANRGKIELLISLLGSQNLDTRFAVAKALGDIKAVEAVDPLIAMLKDKNIDIRYSAASALGKIKDIRAIEPLIDAFLRNDWGKDIYGRRAGIASALGEFNDSRVVDLLTTGLKDSDEQVRKAAENALKKFHS